MKYVHTDTAKYIQDMGVWDSSFHNVTAALYIPTSPPSPPSQGTYQPMKSVASGFQSIPEAMVEKFLDASARYSTVNVIYIYIPRAYEHGSSLPREFVAWN